MSGFTTPNPVELTADEQEERAKACFKLDQQIKKALKNGREAMWEVARAAHEFDEANGWTALGYDKVSDWLADPEVGITYRTFFRMVSTYRELVVIRQVPQARLTQLDASKVDIVLPAVKAGRAKLEDALGDVEELGARDLRSKYINRPDPADSVPAMPDSNELATRANVGIDDSDPEGDVGGSDEPVSFSPATEPAHNSNGVDSGQVQVDEFSVEYDAVDFDATADEAAQDVVEGNGREVTVRVPDGKLIQVKYVRGIAKLAQEGREALKLPDRQAPDRRAKRDALENLILGLEAAGLA